MGESKQPGQTSSLQVDLPQQLKRQLAVDAARSGSTIRAIILQALAKSGYEIDAGELRDKRKG